MYFQELRFGLEYYSVLYEVKKILSSKCDKTDNSFAFETDKKSSYPNLISKIFEGFQYEHQVYLSRVIVLK